MQRKNLPTIGIDCRFAQTHSGIGRYVRELVTELSKQDDPWKYVLFLSQRIPHELEEIQSERIIHYPLSIIHYSFREQFQLPRIIKQSKIDLLHVPHFNVPLLYPVPFITTIHDLILHEYPNEAGFIKRTAYQTLMKNAVKKSKHIISVSNATMDALGTHYGKSATKKTTVIWNGVAERMRRAPDAAIKNLRERHKLPEQFLLYVGAAKEHKNLQTLIDAAPKHLLLILCTDGKEMQHLRLRSNTRILEGINDEDLPILYSAATVFILPSLTEGFGLPVLEAMTCGTRVVATRRGSIPEIAGEHAILVEPTKEDLQAGIEQALRAPWDKEEATKYATSFTWKRAAEETATVYSKALETIHRIPNP